MDPGPNSFIIAINLLLYSKVPRSKELKKKAIEMQTQIVAEICQNRTADKGDFFEDLLLLKSKSAKLMKVWI
jgi:hypothetical protein